MTRLVSSSDGIGRLAGDVVELLDVPYGDLSQALRAGVDCGQLATAGVRGRRETGAVTLLAPVPLPSKVWAVGWSYGAHAQEGGRTEHPPEPFFFLKAPSSVIGPDQMIRLPRSAPDCVDYEGELAVVIGSVASHITEAQARAVIAGYTIANDVSARDVQKGEKPGRPANINLAKSFDGFMPLGPCLTTLDELADPDDLALTTHVDGVLRQRARTSDLLYGVATQVSYISRYSTLYPGDVILTGTPAGVGFAERRFLRPGMTVRIEIEGLGTLKNQVEPA